MIETVYYKGLIKLNHVWFLSQKDDLRKQKKADIYFFHGIDWDMPKDSVIRIFRQNTLISDLTLSTDDLLKGINKTYRYEIRRCEKEKCDVRLFSASDLLINKDFVRDFRNTYNQMFQSKGIKETFNESLFYCYAQNNVLIVTAAYREGKPVVFHSYIVDGCNSRFWYSCSNIRTDASSAEEIGRLNKYLHWFDFVKLKNYGISKYDWGGVNFSDPEIKGISEFKKKFGGEPILYNNILVAQNGCIRKLLNLYLRK